MELATLKKNFLAGLELARLHRDAARGQLWVDTVANVRVHGDDPPAPDRSL